MHKKQQAFTLLELTIVLVVIAIMTVGIFKGAGLVNSSKISVARSLTERSPVPKIDGLVVWYETSSLDSLLKSEASNNSTVTTWYDLNPTSVALRENTLVTKTGAVKYVKNGINNVPSLQFSSKNDLSVANLQLAAFSQGSTAQNTVFLVFKQQSRTYISTDERWILDSHFLASSSAIGYADISGVDTVRSNSGTTVYSGATNPPSFGDEKSFIVAVYYDQAYTKAYVNDATVVTGGGYFNATPGSNKITGLTIGSLKNDNNANRFVGLISEIIIYNRVLKSDERKDIFAYLSKKYSIPVAGI
jgi:prepilin-type N-terminal cleavage/methylation domain-containing protein